METLNRAAERIEKHSWSKKLSMLQAMNSLKRHFHAERAPAGWGFENLINFMQSFIEFGQQHADKTAYANGLRKQRFGTLLMAAMHFQDNYNYEIDRSRHCVILYEAPNGRFYPFCTYNSGPCYRNAIEREFSRPLGRKRAIEAVGRAKDKVKNTIAEAIK